MGGASRFIMLLTTPLPFHPRPSLLRLGRHSRVLMSSVAALSASSYHSPASRPKLVFPPKASHQIHTQTSSVKEGYFGDSLGLSSPTYSTAHPWPEWSKLLDTLSANGFFDQAAAEGQGNAAQDAFVAFEGTSEEFILAATACLAFARHRYDLLGSLSRKDIEVIVKNGTPFLFKNALDTARRMRSFLGSSTSNVLEFDRANTVDLMKYILSYAKDPNFSSDRRNLYNGEVVESSVRALLSQLAEVSYRVQEMNVSTSVPDQSPDRCGKAPRFLGQKIEMKRGDWICPRCSFMNFARNVKCIECEEARPRRQLSGGEWECPQCDFFNYGRNMVCLRCDCKRPGETSFGISHSRPGMGHNNGDYANKADIDNRLAVNEEKAQRWFSKVSQLDNASDLSKAADDEDFPEIMPLRKGVNRFVVSTRKTPLERRLANSQYQRNLSDGGIPVDNQIRTGVANKSLDMPVSRSLDEILGRTTTVANTDNRVCADGQTDGAKNSVQSSSSASSQLGNSEGSNSSYAPFMPSFAKKPHNSKTDDSEDVVSGSHFSHPSKSNEQMGPVSERNESGDRFQLFEIQAKSQDKEKEEAEKSNNWFDRVAELHDVKDLPSAISDEDFPEIMPMRKGENRFVVSKRKDRSLTSPMYKRKMAMEQAGNNNFVPFVPFPPGYFAKKDKQQQDETDSTTKIRGETSSISGTSEKLPGKLDYGSPGLHNVDSVQIMENQQTGTGRWNMETSGENFDRGETRAVYGEPNRASRTQDSISSQMIGKDKQSSVYFGKENTAEVTNVREDSLRPVENQNVRSSWTGKSLEGSAVTEPDPLDMSEEAKAQRWFRRVAQIKDISELSQIPDEDFPSIMPMRKGVNRFVVSKRKTPLERRLTSPQHRRNLPIVSSDPIKKENDQT